MKLNLVIKTLGAGLAAAISLGALGPASSADAADARQAAETAAETVGHRATGEAVASAHGGATKAIAEINVHGTSPRPKAVSDCSWWGCQDWFSKSEVRWYAQSAWVVRNTIDQFCRRLGVASWPCKQVAGRYVDWIFNTFAEAARQGQCVTWKMTWTGQVVSVSRYTCNWN